MPRSENNKSRYPFISCLIFTSNFFFIRKSHRAVGSFFMLGKLSKSFKIKLDEPS